MRRTGLALVAAIGLLTTGCAGLNDTQQRTLTGGAAGAAGGAAIGALAGDAGAGAAVGGAAGLAGGFLYDQYKRSQDDAYRRGVRRARQDDDD